MSMFLILLVYKSNVKSDWSSKVSKFSAVVFKEQVFVCIKLDVFCIAVLGESLRKSLVVLYLVFVSV